MSIRTRIGQFFLTKSLATFHFEPAQDVQIRHASVVFCAEQLGWQQACVEFCQSLESDYGFKAHLLAYVPRRLESNVKFSFSHYNQTDLSWSGYPMNKELDLFLQRPTELVLNLDRQNIPSLHFISHKLRAKHKLASSPDFPDIYNVILKGSADLSEAQFFQEFRNVVKRVSV